MSFRIRAARLDDAPALYEIAKLTGGGFTNLPPDMATLEAKLALSAAARIALRPSAGLRPACAERPVIVKSKLPLPGRAPASVPSGKAEGS